MKKNIIFFAIFLLTAPVMAQSAEFTLGAFFQPGISYRMLSYQNQEAKEVFQSLPNTEKLDIGWEGGIIAYFYLSDYIHLESGISISKKGYRSILSVDDLAYREPEDPQLIDLMESTSSHEFYFVAVPIRTGVTIYQDRTFATGVRAGVNLDYHFRSTIRYENIYRDRTENSVVHPDIPNFRKMNISGSLSVFGSYELSDQYRISLEPYCSLSILPVVNDSDIKSRFLLIGLRVSLSYKF